MNDLLSSLENLANHLYELNKPWALVGALASNEYTSEPRFTSDIDIMILIDTQDNVNNFLNDLSLIGYAILEISNHPDLEHVTSAKFLGLSSEHGRFFIDLIFQSTEVEHEITANAISTEILPGLTIPIAKKSHLIAMKLLAIVSPERSIEKTMTDKADLIGLLKTTSKEELKEARTMADLINERYTLPIRNLNRALDRFIEDNSLKR